MATICTTYDGFQNFDSYVYSCLSNKIKTEMTRRNREKRKADRMSVSIDASAGDDDSLTVGDLLEADFDMERELSEKIGFGFSERMEQYWNTISEKQREIAQMLMDGYSSVEIRKRLDITQKQYSDYIKDMKSFEKARVLKKQSSIMGLEEEKTMQIKTLEKSKQKQYSIASIIKKMENNTILFNHPTQRESEQWSPKMKGNLISDILQNNPIPALVFAEQIIDGNVIIWDLDGKQRCTNVFSFINNEFKVSKNVRRWNIAYQVNVLDCNGEVIRTENGLPKKEQKICDIRGKKYSDLPEELQEVFNDYTFEVTQYLNCSDEDISYHISRYNEGRAMTPAQKGIASLGTDYASLVKSISAMPFFKDKGGYKVSEFRNGTIDRIVIESVMAANFLNDWKKGQEEMCVYIRENATSGQFENFEEMVERLEKVVTEDISEMFNAKDSFLWFGLFARFVKTGFADQKFIEFMAEFKRSLHSKKINGESFDHLMDKAKSTKDKGIIVRKLNLLETLMLDYLCANRKEESLNEESSIVDFVRENVDSKVTKEDIDLYEDVLKGLSRKRKKGTRLLERKNRPSLIGIIAYSFERDVDLDDWIVDFFQRNCDYVKDQRENYLYMKDDLEDYLKRKSDLF